MVLYRNVGKDIGQPVLFNQFCALFGVRANNINRKLGSKFLMQVVLVLVFGKHFGIFQLAYVVIIRHSPCKFGVLAYRACARFGKLRNHHHVVVSTQRVLFKFCHQLCVVGSKLAQPKRGKLGEKPLHHGQNTHKQQHRKSAVKHAENYIFKDIEPAFRSYERQLHYQIYYYCGDKQHKSYQHAAKTGFNAF